MPDSQYKIKASFTGIENVIGNFKKIEVQIRQNTAALREQQQLSGQMGKVPRQAQTQAQQVAKQQAQGSQQVTQQYQRQRTATHRLLETNARFYHAGREARYMWREQTESLRNYTDAALRLNQAQQKFKAINLSPEENELAFQAVRKTVGEIKGLKASDATDLITDLHTALGDLGHAMEAMPAAAKFRVGFQSLFGEKFSPEELENQVQNAFKYLEVTGAVAQGRAEMESRFNLMAQLMSSTGGRVKPSDLLVMARRAGPAAQGLSLAGMRNLATAIPELSGTGAGTSMMSLYQTLIAGVMKQSAAVEFQRLGLLDPKKIEYGKAQKLKKLMPGANKLGALLMEDPLKAADALMEAMRKPLKGAPIDTSNANKVREEMAILFGNRTAQRLMVMLTTQRGQVIKEARLAEGAKTIQEIYDQALGTPSGKIQAFEAAVENLRAEIGGPLLSAVAGAARALTPFMNFMSEHPKIVLTALAVFKLTSALSALATVAQTAGIMKLLSGGAAAGAGAGAGVGAGAAGAGAGAAGAAGAGAGAAGGAAAGRFAGLAGRIARGAGIGIVVSELWGEIFNSTLSDFDAVDEQVAKLRTARDKVREERFKLFRETGGIGGSPIAAGQQRTIEEQIGQLSAQYPTFRDPTGWLGQRSSRPQDQEKTDKATISTLQQRKFGSANEVAGFLKGISELDLAAGSRAAKLREDIQRLATAAWPQFAKELAELNAVAPGAAVALGQISEQLRQFSFLQPLGAPSAGLPPRLPGRKRFEWKPPGLAEGGITQRATLAMVGEGGPELIAPLSKLEGILERAQGERSAARGGNQFSFQIDARGSQAGVGAEIKRAIMEALRETGLDGLTHDGFRDRALAI